MKMKAFETFFFLQWNVTKIKFDEPQNFTKIETNFSD